MKKCPTCDKTFEDSMRFCQIDGTLLVDDAPDFDPYATIVGHPVPVAPAVPPFDEAETGIHYTVGSIPISEPDDVLDLPVNDPLKTMYVSDAEMHAALGKDESTPDIIEIPPIDTVSQPDPPSFIATDSSAPPPSPFSVPNDTSEQPAPLSFEVPESAPVWGGAASNSDFETQMSAPATPTFDEAATVAQPSFNSPFDSAPAPVAEWTPPPAPDQNWQNKEIGANAPFQQPPVGAGGQNKTLAIISLVCGILGMTVCCGSFAVSIVALVTGFMARSKAAQNPNEFGGAGLAMGGMITGGIGILLSVVVIILYFAGLMAGSLGSF